MNLYQLHKLIVQHFSKNELYTLCLGLNIQYELLPTITLGDFVRELIVHCQRRALLEELIALCQSERPFINWGQFLLHQTNKGKTNKF